MQNDARGVGLPINQTITLSRIADSVDPKLRSCTCPPFILLRLFVLVDLKRSDHALVPPSSFWVSLSLLILNAQIIILLGLFVPVDLNTQIMHLSPLHPSGSLCPC